MVDTISEREWLDIFANNLIEMLREEEMTQKELADAIGVTEATISSYINKKRMPGVKALVNISHVLCCSMDDLMYFGYKIE